MAKLDNVTAALWQRASAAADRKDRAAIERIGLELAASPSRHPSAEAYYTHGRVLLLLTKEEEALAAFERGLALDPHHPQAHYSVGILLAEQGRSAEAVEHWESAVAADPRHIDALYNLGQAHYKQGAFTQALARWSAAHKLEPRDLEILKKVVQAQHTLDQFEAAATTLDVLSAIYAERGAAAAARQHIGTEIVIDQFRHGRHQVFAYMALTPPSHDLDYIYTFKIFEPARQVLLSVQLESSAYGRENGVPYLLGMTTKEEHQLLGPSFQTLPTYRELKSLVLAALSKYF